MSYSVTDQGSGYQLTRLLENERDWQFAERSLWRIGLVEVSGGTFYGWWDASTFAVPTLTDSGSTFIISWVNGQSSSVTVTGLRVSTHLSLALSLTITLAGTDATNYAINRVEFPRFAIKPYEQRYPNEMHVAIPSVDGLVQRGICAASSLVEMDISNHSYIEPDTTTASKNIGSAQFTYLYQEKANSGLLIRTYDHKLRFKRWIWAGDGSNALFTLLHCPTNNMATTSYVMPFPVEILPQPGGDWYDGCVRYRSLVESDYSPWLSAGKLAYRGRSSIEDAAGCLVFLSSDPDWQEADISQLKDALPWDIGLIAHTQEGNGKQVPDDVIPSAGTAELTGLLQDTYDTPVFWYFLLNRWDPNGKWYSDGEWNQDTPQDPSTLIVYDSDGNPVGAEDGFVYPDYSWPGTLDTQRSITSRMQADASPSGFYFDAGLNWGVQNYIPSLPASGKGAGSEYYHDGRHLFYRDMAGSHLSEHTQEFYQDVIDGMSLYGSNLELDPYSSLRRVAMFPTVYSQYQAFWDPLGDITYLVDDSNQGWLVPAALHQLYSRFMFGCIPTILIPARPYRVGTGTNQTLITNAWVQAAQIRHYFSHYFRGKRLRPPPGCREREIEEDGFTLSVDQETLTATIEGDAPHVSVWQSNERPGSPLGIFLANHRSVAVTYTLTLDRRYYPELDENEYLVRTDTTTGARTLIKRSLHGFSETVTIPARTMIVIEAVSMDDAPGGLKLSNGIGNLLLADGTPLFCEWPAYLQLIDDTYLFVEDER